MQGRTCEMLMKEPLEPLVTILMMLLDQSRLFCAVLPAGAAAPHSTHIIVLPRNSKQAGQRHAVQTQHLCQLLRV